MLRVASQKSPAYQLWGILLCTAVLLGVFAVFTPRQQRMVVHFSSDSTVAERDAWMKRYDVMLRMDALDAAVIDTRRPPMALSRSGIVQYAEIDAPIYLLQDDRHPLGAISHPIEPAPPPEPLYAEQWNLQAIAAPDAWMRLPREHDVRLAIIDSGMCLNHPEFSDVTLLGYDFVEQDTIPQDEHGHGCGVAGILGATRQNDIGIAGLLTLPELMSLRVADEHGEGYVSSVAAALVYATDHDADIINMSLGTHTDTLILQRAVDYASHIPMVAATSIDGTTIYPAAYDDVLAVGAYDRAGQVISDGAAEYHAPGVDILTTGLGGQVVEMHGTSAATAHITGMLALEMLTDGEMILEADASPELLPADPVAHASGAREVRVFVIVYQSSTPLYNPLKLNALTLADMTRSTIAHGYDNPTGQPALEFVLATDPVVVQGAPPVPDPNYDASYNYAAIYEDFDLCARIQRLEVDEVWIWGEANPNFGHGLEWVTNGPQLRWTWGSNVPDCGRTITTMWFEYNREVALALHSYGHRMEGAFMMRMPCQFMTATYPWAGADWLAEQGRASDCPDSLSDEKGFVARGHANNQQMSVCGDVHAPPNVLPEMGEYLYSEPNQVRSMCEDWQRDGTGTYQVFGCERWNCNERDYHIWWKQNLPSIGYEHRDTDGSVMPNWYDYLFDMDG